MKSLAMATSAALLLSLAAGPALAANPVRPADSSGKKDEGNAPQGIEVAQTQASDKAGQGHGSDVPKGNGNGYGHDLHDHDDSPS